MTETPKSHADQAAQPEDQNPTNPPASDNPDDNASWSESPEEAESIGAGRVKEPQDAVAELADNDASWHTDPDDPRNVAAAQSIKPEQELIRQNGDRF